MEQKIRQVVFPPMPPKALRVAAYARVSSGKDAMLNSLSSQVSYYNQYIQNKPGWIFCGVYSDAAKTGTKEDRYDFQRLLADCKAKKIDMVLTKSISRFARNTVTLLSMVRELSALHIDVYFERENLHSTSKDGELMLSLLASIAQEESLSASENQKWRVKQNFQSGKPWRGFMLGYRYDGEKYVVVPEEAEIVRRIFSEFIEGKGVHSIAGELNAEGILTQQGYAWRKCAVTRILRNYAYTGNLLLQTKYRENHLTKRTLVNHGELPQYHVLNTHEPIIDLSEYHYVQAEMQRRADKYGTNQSTGRYPFSGMITCAICGKHYRRKTTATGPVWICSTYNDQGKKACASKAVPELVLLEKAEEASEQGEIVAVTAERDNTLIFTMADGSSTMTQWKDRSRSESWTEEKRAAVGIKNRERSASRVSS